MPKKGPETYRATAVIDFPRVTEFLEAILTSITTHDMTSEREDNQYKVVSPFGQGWLQATPGYLHLLVETDSISALNRLKHTLAGPILFIAASEKLDIHWQGDESGLVPLDDLRVLHVVEVLQLTPHMRRIRFRGKDIAHLDRSDQLHCRLIFQPKGIAKPEWPMLDDRGHIVWLDGRKLDTRVYTIRKADVARGEITIDFALHNTPGPATNWALAATPGDIVGIVGPAADGPRQAGFYVLAGDETGLPGIARILEWMDDDAKGVAFIEIDSSVDEQSLRHPSGIELCWLHRNGAPAGTTSLLIDAIRLIDWPDNTDQAFFWGGCEHRAFREIHRMLRNEIWLPRQRQVFYSHWHRSLSEEQIIEIGGGAYLPG